MKNSKKIKQKKQNFDFKSLFTIVIFKMFKNDKIWASKKCHYWHFLLFQNSEKAVFSASLCSEKKTFHPLTHRGKLFLFFIFLLKVIEYFLLSFMAHWKLWQFFFQKKVFSGVHFEKKGSKNYICTSGLKGDNKFLKVFCQEMDP